MKILKVYSDLATMVKAASKIGTDMGKWVCNYHDVEGVDGRILDIELLNGVRFQFRVITSLQQAMNYTSGCVYPFVEFTSEFISDDAKNFIMGRIRDPRDYQ